MFLGFNGDYVAQGLVTKSKDCLSSLRVASQNDCFFLSHTWNFLQKVPSHEYLTKFPSTAQTQKSPCPNQTIVKKSFLQQTPNIFSADFPAEFTREQLVPRSLGYCVVVRPGSHRVRQKLRLVKFPSDDVGAVDFHRNATHAASRVNPTSAGVFGDSASIVSRGV